MNFNEIQKLLSDKPTKYLNHYLLIISKALSENRIKMQQYNDCYELHHILPRSIFKEYENLRQHPWNGVLLTMREHTIVHILIYTHYSKIQDKTNATKMGYPLVKMLGSTRGPMSTYIQNKSRRVQSSIMQDAMYNIFKTANPSNTAECICEYCGVVTTKSALVRWHSWNCLQNPHLISENRGKIPQLSSPVIFHCTECGIRINPSNLKSHNTNCLHSAKHPRKDILIVNGNITDVQCEHCDKWAPVNAYRQSHGNNCFLNPASDTYKRRKAAASAKAVRSAAIKEASKGSFAVRNLMTGEIYSTNTPNENIYNVATSKNSLYILVHPSGKRVMFMNTHCIDVYEDVKNNKLRSFIINRANRGEFTPYNRMVGDSDYIALTGFESISINVNDFQDYMKSNPTTILYNGEITLLGNLAV